MTQQARILHAAARGARIQSKLHDGEWRNAFAVMHPEFKGDMVQRIHPEDEALQYGPISTALLYYAQYGDWEPTKAALMAHVLFDYESPYPFQWFALFLAEFLADEGM